MIYFFSNPDKSTYDLYGYSINCLNDCGYQATLIKNIKDINFKEKDILISHCRLNKNLFNDLANIGVHIYSGLVSTRKQNCELAEKFDIPTADWASPSSLEEAYGLFDQWNSNDIIYKKSFLGNGHGFFVIHKKDPVIKAGCSTELSLSMINDRDIFCKVINDNKLYKLEAFNGTNIISWYTERFHFYAAPKKNKVKRPRFIYDFDKELEYKILYLSKYLTSIGCTYVSFDFMNDNGVIKLIEINTADVATWWNTYQPHVQEKLFKAILNLVKLNIKPEYKDEYLDRQFMPIPYRVLLDRPL